MYKPNVRCRACGYGPQLGAETIKAGQQQKLLPVFNLGIQPLANDFQSAVGESSGFAPLQVMFCPRCTLAQLSVTVRPDILYRNYNYVTSHSEAMFDHFDALNELVFSDFFTDAPGKRVLEIGSNDGTYLGTLADCGDRVLGIDPSENLSKIAQSKHIPTITGIFNADTANEAMIRHPEGYDAVMARHVFCHVDDWQEFVRCLALVTHKNSVVCLEVPYVLDMIEAGSFDQIYHEHTSYMSIKAMKALLAGSAFFLHRVQRFPIHGGAIAMILRRRDSGLSSDVTVSDFEAKENITLETWQDFSCRAYRNLDALKNFVHECQKNFKKVVGYGASAKSTVWVNACKFTRNELAFIVDETPQKQWKLSPGSDIPIIDEGAILRELPDYVVVFAWNWRESVLKKNELAISKGVKFVFPIPKLEVV